MWVHLGKREIVFCIKSLISKNNKIIALNNEKDVLCVLLATLLTKSIGNQCQ